jgi:sensor domain CHASE-containing protein
MNMRKKSLLFVGLITCLSLLITFIFLHKLLTERFAELDERDIKLDMDNILFALDDEMQIIKTNMVNYSAWDDTCEFIKKDINGENVDNDPYILDNFPDSTYTINHLHLLVF